jgi:hypothetical protein
MANNGKILLELQVDGNMIKTKILHKISIGKRGEQTADYFNNYEN